jgi:hypothetical protein
MRWKAGHVGRVLRGLDDEMGPVPDRRDGGAPDPGGRRAVAILNDAIPVTQGDAVPG